MRPCAPLTRALAAIPVASVLLLFGSGWSQTGTVVTKQKISDLEGGFLEPLGNARVSLVTEGGVELGSMLGGQYSEAVTDADGAYEFLYLRPGEYAVAAGGALFGGAFGNESASGRTIRAGLSVEEGRTLEGVDFQLETPGSIAGRVVDTAGQPVKDASIFVRDASGRSSSHY